MATPLERLPLAEQLAFFAGALAQGDPREALRQAAALADPEPLAWLAGELARRAWLSERHHRDFLAEILLRRPDVDLDRALQSLSHHPSPGLTALLEALLEPLGPERVTTLSLLDRALRRLDPMAWKRRNEGLERAAILGVSRGELPSPALLACIPSSVLPELRGVAERAGLGEALRARQAEVAAAVYGALAAAPKGLSQANAEALLSKQVYTEPGHFLIELLQNAVDAGARRFSVRFGEDRVIVWHDGLPFDARDVVGVCSIGQTTKRQDQIGFFGVGFKSVYELTERPCVYSEGWNFEIANVSIPRPLEGRPPELPAGGTVIALPCRANLDPSRSPRALFAKLARLDPCVLITLPGLEALELSLDEPAARRELRLKQGENGLFRVDEGPTGAAHLYRVVEGTHRAASAREAGRPGETRVLLGALCDAAGHPTPMPPGHATVYSYLPTEEPSGLRFFVQGHFDVPVDRERLNPESAWNRDILALLPTLLAELCRGVPPEGRAGLAEVLPLPEELRNPLWRPLAEALPGALGDLPLFPDATGQLRPARRLLLAEAELAAAFAGEPLSAALFGGAGEAHWLHPGVSPRARALAASLGATRVDAHRLLEALEARLRRTPDGAVPTDPALPGWILQPEPRRLLALAGALFGASPARVVQLPIFPGDDGGLYRAPRLRLARGATWELLTGLLPLAPPDCAEDDAALSVLARAGVRELGPAEALGVLERLLAGRASLGPDAAPIGPERVRRAWRFLAEAPPELARRALALPLLLCEDGHHHTGQGAALRAPAGPFTNPLRVLYAGSRPIAVDDPSLDAWLERAGAESLDVEALLQDLGRRVVPERGRIQAFHAALSQHGRELPAYAVELLAQERLWPTPDGGWRAIGELVDAPELVALCAPGSPERAALDGWITEGPALDSLRALSGIARPRPAADAARELVRRFAREGAPLAEQGALLRLHRAPLAALLRAEDPAAAVPLADASGRLRTGPLHEADEETRALLRGLPAEAALVAPGEPGLPPQVRPFPALPALEALIGCPDSALPAFYAWILRHEREVLSDPACRELLAGAPILPSASGRRVPARDLVLDPELPKLGIDALPHPEVPQALIALFVRGLGLGQITPDELVRRHLRPAYEDAARRGDRPAAAALFDTMLRRVRPLSGALTRSLLQDLPLEDQHGVFRPASALFQPDPRIAEEAQLLWPEAPRPGPAVQLGARLLGELGVRSWPGEERLREVLTHPGDLGRALALCGVLGALRDEALLDRLPLRAHPWLPDGAGRLRHPETLYQRGAEIEALIGDDPSLYPDDRALSRLGGALTARLGLGGPERVGPDEVVAHIAAQAERGAAASPRVYAWLERGLAEGRFGATLLRDRLAHRPWILSDDGRLLPAERVIGAPCLRLFGLRRGSWSAGPRLYPTLSAAFRIPAQADPEVIASFLAEIGREVQARGAPTVLREEPGLPRLLLTCFDALGRAGVPVSRELRVLPALPARGGPPALVAAATPGLYRSDTPTLEAIFAPVGPLLIAVRGEREEAEGVEQFLERMGVPRLRGAWRARPDPAGGADTTAENGPYIAELRAIFRALLTVLPRVRAWRKSLPAERWTWEERLRGLATSGPIACVRGLTVQMELAGVGIAKARMDAVRDPTSATLFVEEAVLRDLPRRASHLAEGVLPCVYDGPGEDLLVELLEILLPLGDAAAMGAYLDRRHFPVVREPEDPRAAMAAAVGEILDIGLAKLLFQRHEALRDLDPERWRDPALARALPPEPAAATRALLRALGAPEGGPHAEALERLLRSGQLEAPPGAEPAPTPWREPTPAVRTTVPPPPPPPRVEAAPGLLDRLRKALFGERLDDLPAWLQANPLAPQRVVPERFWATPEAVANLNAQKSPARLDFLPTPLPAPFRYVIHTLAGDFDPGKQLWRPSALPGADAPLHPTAFTVSLQGTLPPGSIRLPVPMFAVPDGPIEVLSGPKGAVEEPRPEGPGWLVQVWSPEPVRVRYAVRLCALPHPDGTHPGVLTQPTVPLRALPEPVQRWLAAQDRAAPPQDRARAAERFVLENYAYDRDYLRRPEVIAARARLRAGQGHHALEVLHASAGGGLLGRGMCVELNTLVAELGQHLGVPMAIATGWMMDLGWLERPDHFFALALLSSSEGLFRMPLDAARAHDLSPGAALPAPPAAAVAPPRPGAWAEAAPKPVIGGPVTVEDQLRAAATLLDAALRLTCATLELPLPLALEEARHLPPAEAVVRLRAALEGALPRPELAPAVVAMVRGDWASLEHVPPEARALQTLGLAKVELASSWRVRPAR